MGSHFRATARVFDHRRNQINQMNVVREFLALLGFPICYAQYFRRRRRREAYLSILVGSSYFAFRIFNFDTCEDLDASRLRAV